MTLARKAIVQRWTAPVLFSGLMFLFACGGGYTPVTTGHAVTIELATSQNFLIPGASAVITATVYDQSNQGVTWIVTPQDFGTLSNQTSTNQPSNFQTTASVTFTAPPIYPALTTVTIRATSVSNPNISTSLQLKALPITIALFVGPIQALVLAAPQTLNQGEQLQITSFVNHTNQQGVTWRLSPTSGAGTLASPTSGTVTYVAPAAVASPTPVELIATSISFPSVTTALPITVFPSGAGPNVAAVTVDGGPVPGQVHQNGAFTSVTICNPGSSSGIPTCQVVGGILVDTGSSGLRILQSQMPLLQLPTLIDANGNTLENCYSLLDGSYLWGPVSSADVYIGGEGALSSQASGGTVQVISNVANNVPTACSNGGTDRNTPQLLGANGILGVGPEPTDCTLAGKNYCDGSTQPVATNRYFSCPSVGCSLTDSSVIVTALQQVTNPVALSSNLITGSRDNNGSILDLPVASNPESTMTGRLIFGIGTQLDNSLGSATVYTLDSEDHFTTLLNGQKLTSSFLDSGSSALLFPSSLPTCSAHAEFYCPSSPINWLAVNKGATQGQGTVSFTVDNTDKLFSEFPYDAVFNNLAGPEETLPTCSGGTTSCAFVWGLPFFYGRTVYGAIDGQTVSSAPPTPWWAY